MGKNVHKIPQTGYFQRRTVCGWTRKIR